VLEQRGHVGWLGLNEVEDGFPIAFGNVLGLHRGSVGPIINLHFRLVRLFITGFDPADILGCLLRLWFAAARWGGESNFGFIFCRLAGVVLSAIAAIFYL